MNSMPTILGCGLSELQETVHDTVLLQQCCLSRTPPARWRFALLAMAAEEAIFFAC